MLPSKENKMHEEKPDKKTFEIASRVHVHNVYMYLVCVY